MIFDLPPEPPKFWLPPKPAIIRQATPDLLVPRREMRTRARRRASAGGPVSYIDDGDFTGGSGTTVNVANVTTTGPVSAFMIGARRGSAAQLNSATLNGAACALLTTSTTGNGCAAIVAIAAAAANHTLALTFNGNVTGVGVTAVSLLNLQSLVAVDADAATGSGGSINLPAMTGPGAEGIVLVTSFDFGDGNAQNWTNATEIADFDAGGAVGRSSSAVVLGNPAGTITSAKTSSSFVFAIAGVSLR